MTSAVSDIDLFKSMDMKSYEGILPLMFDLRREGFEEEFSNSLVMKKLGDAYTTAANGNSCDIKAYCCFTTIDDKAIKALRIEVRNKNNLMSGVNVVVHVGTDGHLRAN